MYSRRKLILKFGLLHKNVPFSKRMWCEQSEENCSWQIRETGWENLNIKKKNIIWIEKQVVNFNVHQLFAINGIVKFQWICKGCE